MTAETLLELAERCEKAGGPDREIDEAVFVALGWKPIPNPTMAGGLVGRWCLPEGSMSGMEGPPQVTASVDAALTLVPEGWAIDNMMVWPGNVARLALLACVRRDGEWWHGSGDAKVAAEAPTAALAITAAALRARAAQAGEVAKPSIPEAKRRG